MARAVPLDKILKAGTAVTLGEREAWIIQAVGTNSSTAGRLKIDNKPTGDIVDIVAPLHLTDDNLLGPLSLGDFYYVVPEETAVEWDGAAGSKARVIGTKIIFEPGEALGEPYISRYKNQYSEYITYVENSYSHGTNTAWANGLEEEVLSITPKTIEKYILDSIIMASIANVNGGVAEGDWAIRFYLDNIPLENLIGTNEQVGIDILSMPRPPTETTEESPFSLASLPIEVLGDHTLSIRARNTSGSSKSPTSGNSITVTVTAIVKFFRGS